MSVLSPFDLSQESGPVGYPVGEAAGARPLPKA